MPTLDKCGCLFQSVDAYTWPKKGSCIFQSDSIDHRVKNWQVCSSKVQYCCFTVISLGYCRKISINHWAKDLKHALVLTKNGALVVVIQGNMLNVTPKFDSDPAAFSSSLNTSVPAVSNPAYCRPVFNNVIAKEWLTKSSAGFGSVTSFLLS